MHIGGMEKALVILLNNLVKEYRITLLLEENDGVLKKMLNSKIKIEEYKVSNNKNIIIRKGCNFLKRFCWTLRNYHRYDFSCSYATYSVIGARLALKGSKNSTLYVHSNYYGYYDGDKERILDFFKMLNYQSFKKMIFVSNESFNLVKEILDIDDKKGAVINNLVNVKEILDATLEKSDLTIFESSNINVLFVGRLDNTSKNFDLLLDSFAKVKNNSVRLFILGDGDYKTNIISKIKQLNLENKVTLLGEKINPYPYMKYCDALILTSKYEGFPLVYTEALVLNKKLITTVPVSDSLLDIKKYFECVDANSEDISIAIDNLTKEKIDYYVDFDQINKANLQKLKKLIEGDGKNEK